MAPRVRALALSRGSEEYLSWLAVERGRAVNTLAAYRRDLFAYEAWLVADGRTVSGTGSCGVDEATVERYVGALRALGKAPASVARALVSVRSMHRFLVDEGMADLDPSADVGVPKVPAGLPKALSEAEVERLLGIIIGDDAVARRDRAILEVLYSTGMRISELVGLSLPDLALTEGTLRAFGKGSKERVVPVGGLARRALAAWIEGGNRGRASMVPDRWQRRSDADAVFLNARGGRLSRQGAWGIVHRAGGQAGLGGRLTPHVLRHSCATHMLERGADIRVVQELLGHASVATTQVYTKVTADRLLAVYDAAHPRAKMADP